MKQLNIAIVMIEPPLPFGNAAGRWFYSLLRGLVERGHQVTAFASCIRPEEINAAKEHFPEDRYDLRCYPVASYSGVTGKLRTLRQPYSFVFHPDLRRDLAAHLRRGVDVLHLEQLWSGWLGLGHEDRSVLNLHYAFSIDQALQPPSSRRELLLRLRTRGAEKQLLKRYRYISALSPRLGQFAEQINGSAVVRSIPMALDLDLYPFESRPVRPDGPPVLGLIGSFNWGPSYFAGLRLLDTLWPRILRRVPEARLRIIGRGAEGAFEKYKGRPGVEIVSDVPDTIPYFRGLDVMLYAPTRASGMKVKIMEAFALGTPVVTTSEGVEGLDARDGVHAGVSDDETGLVHRASGLLTSRELQTVYANNARRLLEDTCTPTHVLNEWESLYAEMMGGRVPVGARERTAVRSSEIARTHQPADVEG